MIAEISPEQQEAVLRALAEGTGLSFTLDRFPEVERAIQAAAPELNTRPAQKVLGRLLAGDPLALEAVASHLTVGETYFLRDPAAFRALRDEILAPLVQQRREAGVRCLRLWSAGCCTGEEAYSLAILLSELLPDLPEWQVSILGTDLNPQFLRKAEAAIYKQWSFRTTAEDFRERYFTPLPGDRYSLLPRYRQMVTFRHLNLAAEGYPSALNGTDHQDVILCRNVLIYFAPEQSRRASERLQASLAPEGWLVPSSAESALLFAPLVPFSFPGVIVYRKTAPRPLLEAPPGHAALPWPSLPGQPAQEPAADREPDAEDLARASRDKANAGDLAEALRLCDLALQKNRLNPRLHHLRGSILQEAEQVEEATKSFRRVTHLDHHFVLAHFALGTLAGKKGRRMEQIRHFETALHLLRGMPADEVVPESAGMTAGRLAEVIASTMQAPS